MRALEIRTMIIYVKKLPRVIHQQTAPVSSFGNSYNQLTEEETNGAWFTDVSALFSGNSKSGRMRWCCCCDCCCGCLASKGKRLMYDFGCGGRKQKRQGSFRRPRSVHLKRITDFGSLKEKYTGTQEESAKMIRRDPGGSGRSSDSVCTKYKSYFIICF